MDAQVFAVIFVALVLLVYLAVGLLLHCSERRLYVLAACACLAVALFLAYGIDTHCPKSAVYARCQS